ncbi:nucleotidyltransferase family protein [Aquibacillus sediminis]|uniref:nucleotidyltransferase family protein n=1 Tax=Aquibacillus sediminis TaxID=2574734 RepID=UPI00110944AF|nr:nucleotidyltransferase domain-containing protein [Aquibacillus sediminis]
MREEILKQLRDILLNELIHEKVRVYLFGSWARQEEKNSSDIDIAIEPEFELSPMKWTDLIDTVEESTIPYKVEIVNLNHVGKELMENVKREGILWKDLNKE